MENFILDHIFNVFSSSVQGPMIGPFELIVSSIEGLRMLVDKFADKEEKDSDSTSPHQEDKVFNSLLMFFITIRILVFIDDILSYVKMFMFVFSTC